VISFFLHGRILGGGGPPPPGIVNPPGWSGALFGSSAYSTSGTASAAAEFEIRSDGTWEATSDAEPQTGNWIAPGSVGIGASYKVQLTVVDSFGAGSGITIIHEAAAVSSLSSNRKFRVEVTRSTGGTRIARRNVRVDIFSLADALLSSGIFVVEVVVEVGS
jgi:hypothetical protein